MSEVYSSAPIYITRGSREPVPEPLPPWDPFPGVQHKQARVDDTYFQMATAKLPTPLPLPRLSTSPSSSSSSSYSISAGALLPDPLSSSLSLATRKLLVDKSTAILDPKKKTYKIGPQGRLKETLLLVTVSSAISYPQVKALWDPKNVSTLISQTASEFLSFPFQ